MVKNLPAGRGNTRNTISIRMLERSSGVENGTRSSILQRRRWHPTPVLLPGKSHGQRSLVVCDPWGREESDTTSDLPFTFDFHALEKEVAAHSSVLAWRIPGTGEPGGPLSMGSHKVRHD